MSHDTTINTESRYYLSTDYPGSPNLPVGFAKLPIFTTYGNTLGLTQRFNRLEVSVKGAVDRTQYQPTPLLDGSSSSNTDRDFNQYSGAVRASYEVFPGVKPFVEVGGDVRKHDLQFDRDGLQRDFACAGAAGRHHDSNLPQQADRRDFGRLHGPQVRGPRPGAVERRRRRRLADLGRHRPDHGDADGGVAGRGDRAGRRVGRAAARRRRPGRSRAAALADLDGAGRLRHRHVQEHSLRMQRLPGARRQPRLARHHADLQVQPRARAQGRVPLRPAALQQPPAWTTTPTSSWSG